MKKTLLLGFCSLTACSSVPNDRNCMATPTICGPAQYCDTTTEICATFKFAMQPTDNLPTVSNVEQLIIFPMSADLQEDLIIKHQDGVTICDGIGTAAVHCGAPLTTNLTSSSFIRIIDINRNKRQSILVIPRASSSVVMGNLWTHAENAETYSVAQYRFGKTNINDAIVVEQPGTAPRNDIWIATNEIVSSSPFVAGGTSSPDQSYSGGLSSLLLTRPYADAVGPQLIGIRPAMAGGGVAVVGKTGLLPAVELNTVAITKLRVGFLNKDTDRDVIGATNDSKFYSALAMDINGYPKTLPIDAVQTTTDSYEIAELDGTGNQGLVLLSDPKTFSYLPGHGDGTFGKQSVVWRTEKDVAIFAAKDINSDGRTDLVYVTTDGSIKVVLGTK